MSRLLLSNPVASVSVETVMSVPLRSSIPVLLAVHLEGASITNWSDIAERAVLNSRSVV
jgi:hypothetical protein